MSLDEKLNEAANIAKAAKNERARVKSKEKLRQIRFYAFHEVFSDEIKLHEIRRVLNA